MKHNTTGQKRSSADRTGRAYRLHRLMILTAVTVATVLLSTLVFWAGRTPAPVPASGSTGRLSPAAYQAAGDRLTELLRRQGAPAAFAYAEARQHSDPSFGHDCHPLMHMLGHAAYGYYGSFAAAAAHQDEMCNSGYLHGVIEASLARAPDIRQAIATTCPAGRQTDFAGWECYHGLGHGAMAAEGRDIDRSLADCRVLPSDFAVDSCANGAYMEYFIMTDHTGRLRAAPLSGTTGADGSEAAQPPADACRTADSRFRSSCDYYAPTAYLELHPASYNAAAAWCGRLAGGRQADCLQGVGAQAMKDNVGRPAVAAQACAAMSGGHDRLCAAGAISYYVNHRASSAAAAPLCGDSFKAYAAVCRLVIDSKKQSLNV